MNVETLLSDVFTDHEHLAPNADEVMTSVRSRIARRRKVAARPLAIAASTVVVAAAAGGAVLLSRHSDRHAPQRQPAAGRSHTAAVNPSSDEIAPLAMPYDLGWLPDGSVSYIARRINVGAVSGSSPPVFDGEYMLAVTTATGTVDVDVQQMPGGLAGMGFKSGSGASITINGRAGIESANSGGPGGYEVYFEDAAGGLMYVNASPENGGGYPAGQLVDIGRRVAENIGFPGTAEVEPSFGVGYVPAGLRVRAFDVEDAGAAGLPVSDGTTGPVTSYDVGTSAVHGSVITIATSVAPPHGGTAGRDVQGHATRYSDVGGYGTLYVLDAVNGQDVGLFGSLALDELYKIADGLVLPGS
jgi:hypothetical protein